MEQIRVLIVEDKPIISESLSVLLTKHNIAVVDICESGEDAVKVALSQHPDLILMDIELKDAMDGISAAQFIKQKLSVPVIFLTDYTDQKTVDRVKKTFPANYLSKPFNEVDLLRAIDIAITNANASLSGGAAHVSDSIMVRTESQEYTKVLISDILFLQADRSYSEIVTEGRYFKLSISMKQLESKINHPDFLKVHRGCIVNTTKITGISGNVIKLGNKQVQMSKDHREKVMSRLKII